MSVVDLNRHKEKIALRHKLNEFYNFFLEEGFRIAKERSLEIIVGTEYVLAPGDVEPEGSLYLPPDEDGGVDFSALWLLALQEYPDKEEEFLALSDRFKELEDL